MAWYLNKIDFYQAFVLVLPLEWVRVTHLLFRDTSKTLYLSSDLNMTQQYDTWWCYTCGHVIIVLSDGHSYLLPPQEQWVIHWSWDNGEEINWLTLNASSLYCGMRRTKSRANIWSIICINWTIHQVLIWTKQSALIICISNIDLRTITDIISAIYPAETYTEEQISSYSWNACYNSTDAARDRVIIPA